MERRVRVKLTCSRSHRCSVAAPGFEPRYCGSTLILNLKGRVKLAPLD